MQLVALDPEPNTHKATVSNCGCEEQRDASDRLTGGNRWLRHDLEIAACIRIASY